MGKKMDQTRRRALQTVGSVLVAGVAGCSSSDSMEETTDAATETPTTESTATSTANATEEPTSTDGSDADQFVRNPEEVHATLVEETSVSSEEVLIGFRLEDSSLPFTTEVYHAPEDAEVQATETYDTQDLGAVDLLPDPPEALDTVDTDREDVHYGTTSIGEPLMVTLLARQDDEETFEWSSWDRSGYPHDGHEEEDTALEVDCYCGGDVYTAPEGGTWARVIQVTPTEHVEPGTTIALNWTSSRA
ncbi:hypothetical protein [Halobellus rufus]|uniref:hypothetical protein n=1 Tax=Halobellus rufus TaxID=1448860 RepID=UPI0006789EDA|nr:hypothetical protein [Halobellus rufus]